MANQLVLAPMELHDLVDLFMKSTDEISGLWSFYMAGSFAAAGFAASAKRLTVRSAALITVGYLLFLAGHLSLLDHTITLQRAAGSDLAAMIDQVPAQFSGSLRAVLSAQSSRIASFMIHLGIDLCIIWITALRRDA